MTVVFPVDFSMADIEPYRLVVESLFERRGPFALVSDINALIGSGTAKEVSGAALRKRLAEDADVFAARGAFLAEYVVCDSMVVRGLYTAYTWLRSKKGYPIKAFGTMDEAAGAAKQLVAAR